MNTEAFTIEAFVIDGFAELRIDAQSPICEPDTGVDRVLETDGVAVPIHEISLPGHRPGCRTTTHRKPVSGHDIVRRIGPRDRNHARSSSSDAAAISTFADDSPYVQAAWS
ncbi:hypothetical protein R4P70_23550 [Rhodococcus sp. IEGM 1241]|uniref:hypothetical protein n=1 Tax=Rhodococcus sp. IEGM 1241 TaxID=3082228 RepID=UPI001595606E|nr:hypothetical protein [Rhodococcus sp. IEGM 1241]MDV8014300.1 hypothetical protein [Rhodococcus sp. IEGM 1241]